jgi:putative redox protein
MVDKVTVTWKDGMYTEAKTPAFDGIIPLDGDRQSGGEGRGHRPLTMLLVGMGGCIVMDAVSILRKKRQEFTHLEVTFDIQQPSEHPYVYTHVHMHVTASGPDISEEALARALELSYTKYCPATAMIKLAAQVDYSYEIIEAP